MNEFIAGIKAYVKLSSNITTQTGIALGTFAEYYDAKHESFGIQPCHENKCITLHSTDRFNRRL
jgi:hypothetical protein